MEVGYFAYGSNLNTEQMEKRIGTWSSSVRAYLEGYKLVFNVKSKRWGGFAANIQKSDRDKVYGVVYFLKKEQLDIMNGYEGSNSKLEKIDAIDEKGSIIHDVSVYWWDNGRPSQEPAESYKKTIMDGLVQHGFAKDIIEKVREYF